MITPKQEIFKWLDSQVKGDRIVVLHELMVKFSLTDNQLFQIINEWRDS